MSEITYTQCSIRRKLNAEGTSCTSEVAWIPSRFAKVGMKLSIRGGDGEWVGGYEVMACHATKNADWLKARERDYLNQRDVSDV